MEKADSIPHDARLLGLLGRYGPEGASDPPACMVLQLRSLVQEATETSSIADNGVGERIEEIVVAFGAGYHRRVEKGGTAWDRSWPRAVAWIEKQVAKSFRRTERYLRETCHLGPELPRAEERTIADLARRFIDGECDCHLWDSGQTLTKDARRKRRARCLRKHFLVAWDAAGTITLRAYIVSAVKGDLVEGTNAAEGRHFAAGALRQSMAWPWLHNAAHVLWVKVLHRLCLTHSGSLRPGQPCPKCRRITRGRKSEAKAKAWTLNRRTGCARFENETLRDWFCLAHSALARLDRSCPVCAQESGDGTPDEGTADPYLIVARLIFILDPVDGGSLREEAWYCCQRCANYYPKDEAVCPNCGQRRSRGAGSSKVYVAVPESALSGLESVLGTTSVFPDTPIGRMMARLLAGVEDFDDLLGGVARVFEVSVRRVQAGIEEMRGSAHATIRRQGDFLQRVLKRTGSIRALLQDSNDDPREGLERLLKALVELECVLKGSS